MTQIIKATYICICPFGSTILSLLSKSLNQVHVRVALSGAPELPGSECEGLTSTNCLGKGGGTWARGVKGCKSGEDRTPFPKKKRKALGQGQQRVNGVNKATEGARRWNGEWLNDGNGVTEDAMMMHVPQAGEPIGREIFCDVTPVYAFG